VIYGRIRSHYIGSQFSFEASFEEYDPRDLRHFAAYSN